jgi:hypothetical protein
VLRGLEIWALCQNTAYLLFDSSSRVNPAGRPEACARYLYGAKIRKISLSVVVVKNTVSGPAHFVRNVSDMRTELLPECRYLRSARFFEEPTQTREHNRPEVLKSGLR